MATIPANYRETLRAIHPLDDEPEAKCRTEGLGRIQMTSSVKISLLVLRIYLTGMTFMLLYHVLDLAGILRK